MKYITFNVHIRIFRTSKFILMYVCIFILLLGEAMMEQQLNFDRLMFVRKDIIIIIVMAIE